MHFTKSCFSDIDKVITLHVKKQSVIEPSKCQKFKTKQKREGDGKRNENNNKKEKKPNKNRTINVVA